jgi:hypothetical protein
LAPKKNAKWRCLYRGIDQPRKKDKMLGTILIILLILALIGAFPRWGYSRDWGYYPSGGLGLVLLIIVVLVLLGRI